MANEKFGVSIAAMMLIRHIEKWANRRNHTFQRIDEKLPRRFVIVTSKDELNEDTVREASKLIIRSLAQLKPRQFCRLPIVPGVDAAQAVQSGDCISVRVAYGTHANGTRLCRFDVAFIA
jgi:hypothetical protein